MEWIILAVPKSRALMKSVFKMWQKNKKWAGTAKKVFWDSMSSLAVPRFIALHMTKLWLSVRTDPIRLSVFRKNSLLERMPSA